MAAGQDDVSLDSNLQVVVKPVAYVSTYVVGVTRRSGHCPSSWNSLLDMLLSPTWFDGIFDQKVPLSAILRRQV